MENVTIVGTEEGVLVLATESGERAMIWSIRSSTPGRSGARNIFEDEIPSSNIAERARS